MNYKATVMYNKKIVTFKVTTIQISGNYELPEFLKKVRLVYGDTLDTLHLKADYIKQNCEDMENGTMPITKDYLQTFSTIYKIPKKITKLGIDPDEELKLDLADRLYQLRVKEGYTQAICAALIGVARTTYAGYESGQNEPDIKTLIRIANIYHVSLDYLVNRQDYE